ncbi:MAG: hypothetical protein ABI183_07480 [Polyangiaceae bacterium]
MRRSFALAILLLLPFATTDCKKATSSPNSSSAAADAAVETADYERVVLGDIKYVASKYDGKRVEVEIIVDAPRNGSLSPADPCTADGVHSLDFPTFPNVDTPDAPECFRLVPGRIVELATVMPKQEARVRVRGVFHAFAYDGGALGEDPANILRTTLSLDAFDPVLERLDYGATTVGALADAAESMSLSRVDVTGDSSGNFESWTLSDPSGNDAGKLHQSPHICLNWSAQAARTHLPTLSRVRVRGRLYVRPATSDCTRTLLIDFLDVLPKPAN